MTSGSDMRRRQLLLLWLTGMMETKAERADKNWTRAVPGGRGVWLG